MSFFINLDQLERILPNNTDVDDWYESLVKFFPQFEITTEQRTAAFLAQCAHESGDFTRLKENLNYRWQTLRKVFPKYFATDAIAQNYASKSNKQEAIANRVYANRMGNGPESSGDGFRYCGRGLIQLTGKNNYSAFANFAGMKLEELPSYLMSFDGAVHSACWFWKINKLNYLADAEEIVKMSRVINGGDNGLEDRVEKYHKILEILNS